LIRRIECDILTFVIRLKYRGVYDIMQFIILVCQEAWRLLVESSIYMIFGLLVSGMLRVFLSPGTVAAHLGRGRFRSVFKAALLGIPVPL
jgi:uncharacterized membrane protein YraQ (UPF0718 family)